MRRWYAAIVSVLIFAFLSGFVASQTNHGSEKRSDVVLIDSSLQYDKNERAPVYFSHDIHTDAVMGISGKCNTCHIQTDGKNEFSFIDPGKETWESHMNAYHDKCIGCHSKTIASGNLGGPVICSGCHRDDYHIDTTDFSARLDKSLHQRHVTGLNRKCDACHHVYDEVNKKTLYIKGKEGSCTYCHPGEGNGKDMTLQKASHNQCITCHQTRSEAGQLAGPNRCEGCHDPVIRQSYDKLSTTERLVMGQKDTMMLDPFEKMPDDITPNRMGFVPFNHANHETSNASCSECHHKDLKACTHCHTLSATEKGGGVNLEKAMHLKNSTRSCLGCHKEKQKEVQCAGCHSFSVTRNGDDRECLACHLAKTIEENPDIQAKELIQSKLAENDRVPDSDIPETLVLNKLEKIYEPVTFPHRKIVTSLAGKINDDQMARYFHQGKYALCMGCHHNTPVTGTPTACSNCHAKTDISHGAAKPGLLGAYHIQCMECHVSMKIRQPESCTQCHKEKR